MPTTQPPTTPPPTTTTTTTPPPSACPCDIQTLSASITTKYFVELLEMGTSFLFPIDIVLQKNENADCQYIGQVTTKLLFYDDCNSLDLIPLRPDDIKTATLSATLTWDDDLDIWTFVWATNFENLPYTSEQLTLSQETPSCPYGTFETYFEDELVCVKDPNDIEELPEDINVLFWQENFLGSTWDENTDLLDGVDDEFGLIAIGRYGWNVACLKLLPYTTSDIREGLVYRSLPIHMEFKEEPSTELLNAESPSNNSLFRATQQMVVELYINKCSNKKIFKVFIIHEYLNLQNFGITIISDNEDELIPSLEYAEKIESTLDDVYRFENKFRSATRSYLRIIPENVSVDVVCNMCKLAYIAESIDQTIFLSKNVTYLRDVYTKNKNNIQLTDNETLILSNLNDNIPLPILNSANYYLSLRGTEIYKLVTCGNPSNFDNMPKIFIDGVRQFYDNANCKVTPIASNFGNNAVLGGTTYSPDYWQNVFNTKFSIKIPDEMINDSVLNKFNYATEKFKPHIDNISKGFGPTINENFSVYYAIYIFRQYIININYQITKENPYGISINFQKWLSLLWRLNRNAPDRFTGLSYQGIGIVDTDCVHFSLNWLLGKSQTNTVIRQAVLRGFIESEYDVSSIELEKDVTITVPTFGNLDIKFNGENGDTGNVVIQDQEFIVKNDNNLLVFDFEGDQEYTFSEIGDTHTITVNGLTYDIVFNGYGSLIFSVITNPPSLNAFDTFITESSYGVDIIESNIITELGVNDNIEIGFNIINEVDLTDNKIPYVVDGISLEIDEAYDQSLFCIIKKDIDQVIYFIFDANGISAGNFVSDFYEINNTEPKFCGVTLTDHTKVPNSLPQTTSSNGVEIVELVDGYTGISFNPIDDSQLNNVSVEVTVEGNTFLIDSAYDGSVFVLNELRTTTNSQSTLFTFLSSLTYGINVFRTSKAINGEFLRMRLLGYY